MKLSSKILALLFFYSFPCRTAQVEKQEELHKESVQKIQRFYRFKKGKILLKREEKEFEKKDSLQQALYNLENNPQNIAKWSFESFTDREFLYLYRKTLRIKKANGELQILTPEYQWLFIDEIIRRFELKKDAYSHGNFNLTGTKEILELYKILNPDLDNIPIDFIFKQDKKLPGLKNGEGKKIFIFDLEAIDDEISHAALIYVDYETKQVFLCDSISFLDREIEAFRKSFGPEFTIIFSDFNLQNDGENCMIFAAEAARIIGSEQKNLFEKLNPNKTKGVVITLYNPLPSFLPNVQSLSKVKSYQHYFDFLEKFSPQTPLEKVKKAFDREYNSNSGKSLHGLTYSRAREEFRDQWLQVLHTDREYFKKVYTSIKDPRFMTSVVGKRRIKIRNHFASRIRLKVLYYMATKRLKN